MKVNSFIHTPPYYGNEPLNYKLRTVEHINTVQAGIKNKQTPFIQSTLSLKNMGTMNELYSMLYKEAEKIKRWKVNIEYELKEKERQLQENRKITEALRKAIQELQAISKHNPPPPKKTPFKTPETEQQKCQQKNRILKLAQRGSQPAPTKLSVLSLSPPPVVFENEKLSLKLEEEIHENKYLLKENNVTRHLCNLLKEKCMQSMEKFNKSKQLPIHKAQPPHKDITGSRSGANTVLFQSTAAAKGSDQAGVPSMAVSTVAATGGGEHEQEETKRMYVDLNNNIEMLFYSYFPAVFSVSYGKAAEEVVSSSFIYCAPVNWRKMIQAFEELRVQAENSKLEMYFKLKEEAEKIAQLEKVHEREKNAMEKQVSTLIKQNGEQNTKIEHINMQLQESRELIAESEEIRSQKEMI
ncbi:Synaptonemal complex protein 1 [Varanus komodoensis]|nr:Synaptonemal complex protein 1 [Varanus komodoensis]